nr:hypothetical protein [Marinobacter sp. es.048]
MTGGAKGIGRGIVLHLADAGWKVAFCDTDRAVGERLTASAEHQLRFLPRGCSLGNRGGAHRCRDPSLGRPPGRRYQ